MAGSMHEVCIRCHLRSVASASRSIRVLNPTRSIIAMATTMRCPYTPRSRCSFGYAYLPWRAGAASAGIKSMESKSTRHIPPSPLAIWPIHSTLATRSLTILAQREREDRTAPEGLPPAVIAPDSRLIYSPAMSTIPEKLLIGLVSISDRASQGVYKDEGIPALEEWFGKALAGPEWRTVKRLIPDERPVIEATLKELVDGEGCHLVLTTGGTGPARRDVTPEATLAVADKEMPGFGEQMRQISLKFVPDGDPVAAGRRDPRQGVDPQPARSAQGDQGNAGRREGTGRRAGRAAASLPRCRTASISSAGRTSRRTMRW